MKFSILFFIVLGIKVRISVAVIYTLKIGDPITCNCQMFGQNEISWSMQKVNGESIPLVTNCSYPYKNCSLQYNEGDISLEVELYSNNLTIQHVKQDMFRLICSPDYINIDNCILNVIDDFGASSTYSPIRTLNQGDPFTCNCSFIKNMYIEWTLEKVNGEKIRLMADCNNCTTKYNSTNFIIVTEDKYAHLHKYMSILSSIVSKLTVKHVEKDMLRVFCSSVLGRRDQCLMNVVDYVRPNNGTSKSTATYSTTHSPGVYLTKYPTLSFLTTPFKFLFLTTPQPTTENYSTSSEQTMSLAMLIFLTVVIPIIGVVVFPILVVCCTYRCAKIKRLQIEREAMRAVSRTPQLTPITSPEPDQNDLSSTRLNPLVHPSNSPLTTESHQHTASIQSSASNDSPPPYSSLFQLRVEPPPYTTVTAENYNCQSAPSQQTPNEPPAYKTLTVNTSRTNSVSSASNLQEPNEPPPPYAVWHIS